MPGWCAGWGGALRRAEVECRKRHQQPFARGAAAFGRRIGNEYLEGAARATRDNV